MTTPFESYPRVTTTFTIVGVVIRYSYLLIAAIVMAMMGIVIASSWRERTPPVVEPAAFRLAVPSLERLSTRAWSQGSWLVGRLDVRQYGRVHDRDTDLTIALIMPTEGYAASPDVVVQESINPQANLVELFPQRHHDLETRFGSVRAMEMTVVADGRRKLCLGYLSRFDTTALQLKGWSCEANGDKPSPDRLACMLDRLTVDAPLPVKTADDVLRERLARPARCWSTPVTQTTDTRVRRPSPPARWSTPNAAQQR